MKLSSLMLFVLTSTVAIGSRTTYIITSTSEVQNCPNNATRCLTLVELIARVHQGQSAFQSQEEVIFQPGVHIVNGTERTNLTVVSVGNLTIRGDSETSNVNITCLLQFNFIFEKVDNVSISNMIINNCTSDVEIYGITRNQSLLFIDLVNNLLLDSIHMISKSQESIAVFMKKGFVQLINSKMSGGSGMYIGFDSHDTVSTVTSTVEISNSIFNNSCVKLETIHVPTNSTNIVLAGMIKNSTFTSCKCWYVINFKSLKSQRINVTIVDANIIDNHSPFLMYVKHNISVHFKGNINFIRNKGIAYILHSKAFYLGVQVKFVENRLMNILGVPMYAKDATISFKDSYVLFEKNVGLFCGGIGGKDAQILINDNSTIDFINNKGQNGGALSLSSQSVLNFLTNKGSTATLNFIGNEAQRGGAIFVTDIDYVSLLYRNLRISAFNFDKNRGNVTLNFVSNSALMGGNQIYGGWIDWFVGKDGTARYNRNNISKYLCFEGINVMGVASDPLRVCLCFDRIPNCTIDEYQQEVYGRAFSLDLVAVGQRFGTVTTFVEASLKNETSTKSIDIKMVQRNCTTLQYNLPTDSKNEIETLTLEIKPSLSLRESRLKFNELQNHSTYAHLFNTLSITLNITDCPIGFELDHGDGTCICQSELLSLHLSCNSTDYIIYRSAQQWVGVTHEHTKTNENVGIIAHQHCPFDYCNEMLSIRLNQPDDLCAFNRDGILCGRCKSGFSVMLGTSRCKKCPDIMLLAIIPTYILSGLLLVVFLMVLNFTVSVGTINGLIFYANIIKAQHATFFTPETSHSFLSVFIAWLNLDQGIESCFYNGLDTYANTWFRFLFPLYLWFIAVVLIVSSHFSTHVSKLTGNNAVQVLATLFLLSFAKLFQLIIDVTSFTTIAYPDGYRKAVWLVNGNIEIFTGKHIPLFIVAILFVLFSLLYAFILLTIQFLHKISHYRAMFWIHKLKPFFDAYTGPYRASHCYWTGLLLVARIALLITFSVNQHNNPSLSLLAIIVVSFALLGWFSFTKWVYRNTLNNVLEIVNLCNLGVTATVIFFDLHNQKHSPVAIYISTSFAFVQFVCIILYHAWKQLLLTRCSSNLMIKFFSLRKDHEEDTLVKSGKTGKKNQLRSNTVTSTVVEVQTGPQHTYKSYNSCELKEPLISA